MTLLSHARFRQAALGGLVGILTTSCVSIPSSSPVHQGQPVGVLHEPELISNVPPGRQQGRPEKRWSQGFSRQCWPTRGPQRRLGSS